jgi:hypothetical protein
MYVHDLAGIFFAARVHVTVDGHSIGACRIQTYPVQAGLGLRHQAAERDRQFAATSRTV